MDFIIQTESGILPLEVKSGINLKAKRLKFYIEKYRPTKAVRTSPADFKVNEICFEDGAKTHLADVPLYGFLLELVLRIPNT